MHLPLLQIRALHTALKASENAEKLGVAALPRHLRRRTRSHKPYKHSKRPNAKRQRDAAIEVQQDASSLAGTEHEVRCAAQRCSCRPFAGQHTD